MNEDKWSVLVEVLDTGSLSGAAQKLGYTPSGISRMMASLEEETGLTLLERSKEGVSATKTCLELMPMIRDYVHTHESLVQQVDQLRGLTRGRVVIGNAYTGALPRLERIIRYFSGNYPGVELRLVSGFTTGLLEQIRAHQMDLAITTIRPDQENMNWLKLGNDQMVAWVSADSPYAKEKSVPLDIFSREPYIDQFPGEDVDNNRVLRQAGITPKVSMSTMDSYAAWMMVGAGMGIAMNSRLNSIYPGGRAVAVPIAPTVEISIGIASMKDRSPAAERFLAFCGEIGEISV